VGFLTLKEGDRFRVSKNGLMRIAFGAKREEMAEGWRRLHKEELRRILLG
jgi:bifunctional pyridoxal-dependent enzyme with beta-cystathionase and maltose regulon repressor activities